LPQQYDIVIVGGGPAGLAAGLYAARGRRRTVLLERGVIGGQIALTAAIENYPGIENISGFDLAQAMLRQAESYGLEVHYVEAKALERREPLWVVRTDDQEYLARAVIIATGAEYNRLGVPGEEELTGRGVSYCATCDAAFFPDQEVAVVGGGDAAIDEGLFTTRYAAKVYVVHRRDKLRASRILQERAFANPKMTFIWNTVVTEIVGQEAVEGVRLRNVVTGQESFLPVKAVFIFIGHRPATGWLQGLLPMDNGGHIVVNAWMETALPGVFAAGDVRQHAARQVATSVGDGVTAAIAAERYISEHFPD
jgi:thioredoxin reductase (NADPH)